MHEPQALAGSVDVSSYAFIAATLILVLTYAIVISERVNRAVIALLGAGVMIMAGVINQEEAIAGIDFNTIFLLAGMMMIVGLARGSGVFEYVAVLTAKVARGRPAPTIALLSVVTAVFSAFLDNVTTVLLIVPVTITLCNQLKVNPFPFLITTILASNIGGTATLIGDPPNILIGSAVGLSFNDFVTNLGPAVVVILLVQIGINHVIWGRTMHATPEARAEVLAMKAKDQIKNYPLLWKSLGVLLLVVLAFVLHDALHLEAGTIALTGAALLMLLDNLDRHHEDHHHHVMLVFNEIEWVTLFFFIGLFIVITGAEHAGLIGLMAQGLLAVTQGDYLMTGHAILWGSAVLSAIVDNIPFVAAMIPLIKNLGPAMGGDAALMPFWWALSLGACLGGNGTLVGASANLTVAGIAEGMGIRFGFVKFTAYAFWMMLIQVALANAYLVMFVF